MNLPNLVALGLLAMALSGLFFGGVFALTPFFLDTQEVFSNGELLGAPPIPPQQASLLVALPWITAIFLFCICGVPSCFLGAAGLVVWHFLGRPQLDAMKRSIDLAPSLEEKLQLAFGQGMEWVLETDEAKHQDLITQWQPLVLNLDPPRQHRFVKFSRSLELTGLEDLPLQPIPKPQTRKPSKQRVLLGRIGGLLCLLLGAFFCLWPIVMAMFAPVLEELFKVTLGMDLGPENLVVSIAMMLAMGTLPLTFGGGLFLLSHWENRLSIRLMAVRTEAESSILKAFEEQVHHLQPRGSDIAWPPPKVLRGFRGFAEANLPVLSRRSQEDLESLLRRYDLESLLCTFSEAKP